MRANRHTVIESMLTGIDNHTSETYFDDVQSFPQGHSGIYNLRNHRFTIKPWYKLCADPAVASLRDQEASERFRELFESAVRLRMRADVQVGTCLSGGLDSSATSGVASRIYHEKSDAKLIAIHAKSTDRETDESQFARRAASTLELDLHVVEPTVTDFLATLDELTYTQEEPFGSGSMFMGWHVFQRARSLGCTVMLNGQGADEALLGYERYFAAHLRTTPWYHQLQQARMLTRNSKLTLLQLLQYNLYFQLPSLRIARLKSRSYLRPIFKNSFDFQTIRASARSFRDVTEMQHMEISSIQLPHLLRYEDRNSMRHSIETRLPFLDYRLMEFSFSLPIEAKIQNGWSKHVLRKAMSGVLPQDIAWRRDKLGFESPMRSWMAASDELMRKVVRSSPMLQELTNHSRLLQEFDRLPLLERWRYFNLANWERVFEVAW